MAKQLEDGTFKSSAISSLTSLHWIQIKEIPIACFLNCSDWFCSAFFFFLFSKGCTFLTFIFRLNVTIHLAQCNNVKGIAIHDYSKPSSRPLVLVPKVVVVQTESTEETTDTVITLSCCSVLSGRGRTRGAANRTGPRVPPAAPCLWGGDGELLIEVGKRWLINFPLSLPLIFLGHLPGPPIRNVQQLFAASVFAVWTRACARVLA